MSRMTDYVAKLEAENERLEEAAIEAAAALLWQRDYPQGGSIYKTYESTPFHDKELYRAEVREAMAKYKVNEGSSQ